MKTFILPDSESRVGWALEIALEPPVAVQQTRPDSIGDSRSKNVQIRDRKMSGISDLAFSDLAKILEAKDLLAKYSIQRT